MRPAKILVMGLPGAGKTTLARALVERFRKMRQPAAIVDGDAVRMIRQDVDFSPQGRINQAVYIGNKADDLVANGHTAVCSFVCPTTETRVAFAMTPGNKTPVFTVFVDRIVAGRFADTNAMFEIPFNPDCTVMPGDTVEESVDRIMALLGCYDFDPQKPTAMFIGRFQPFHAGHAAIAQRAIAEVGQVCIALRDMPLDDDNPLSLFERRARISFYMDPDFYGRYEVTVVPNIVKVVKGRKAGYEFEQYIMDEETEAISGTEIRKKEGL
jgi:cytidyltransferase-like protein